MQTENGTVVSGSALILNKNAGTYIGMDEDFNSDNLKSLLQQPCEIFSYSGDEISDAVASLYKKGFRTFIAGGGDGTIGTVAGAIAGTDARLGIIPLGTLNHFAKDLNIPLDIPEAIKVIAAGKTKKIDVAEVNGNVFINNSSIGLYPKAVKKRDKQIDRLGGKKWVAMGMAVASVFKRFPSLTVKMSLENKDILVRTPFVFIGNNKYNIDLLSLGSRDNIDEGVLSIYYPVFSSRLSTLKFTLLALLNLLKQDRNFQIHNLPSFTIDTLKPMLEVSLDGEVTHLEPPLKYKIRPLDLTVFIP